MQINAQEVIDSIASRYATAEASRMKELVILEAQVKHLESKNEQLLNENSNLSAELKRMNESVNMTNQDEAIEGDLIG